MGEVLTMNTEEFRLPSGIPADTLPQEEAAVLSFIYENGYTLKTDSGLAKMAGTRGERVSQWIRKWERAGWVHVRSFRYTNGKTERMICIAY